MANQGNALVSPSPKRSPRWYFGGLASAMAAGVTHPLDLVKVIMQTPGAKNPTFVRVAIRVIQSDGLLGLYNGISASLLRQITYSLPRFGLYEVYKNSFDKSRQITFYEQIGVAGVSGFIGGLCGQPADLVNVRMQNDMKRPPAERRNYKHCFDGLARVYRQGGLAELYSGVSMMAGRSALMTVGQAVGYDQWKRFLLWTGYFDDVPSTHLCAGVGAAGAAVLLTQPFDVMKTRMQNAPPGHYTGLLSVVKDLMTTKTTTPTAQPVQISRSLWHRVFAFTAFFKGITPAFVRIGPHTILLFVFKEQLTIYFGFTKSL
ncbi:Mitochondrial substrate solute carrier [Fasciola gigantica]|uniref:Mitochondrial substrate solute carrier n=1 Tax=Fasciola gigantica TaxID=46835 RepID=A0A504YU76_FASGI|nr:Mitochondrial substrate solute carrier [Fasciola gigantica]